MSLERFLEGGQKGHLLQKLLPDALMGIIGRYFVHSGLQDERIQVTISKLP